jgi:hypothetical protein
MSASSRTGIPFFTLVGSKIYRDPSTRILTTCTSPEGTLIEPVSLVRAPPPDTKKKPATKRSAPIIAI